MKYRSNSLFPYIHYTPTIRFKILNYGFFPHPSLHNILFIPLVPQTWHFVLRVHARSGSCPTLGVSIRNIEKSNTSMLRKQRERFRAKSFSGEAGYINQGRWQNYGHAKSSINHLCLIDDYTISCNNLHVNTMQ